MSDRKRIPLLLSLWLLVSIGGCVIPDLYGPGSTPPEMQFRSRYLETHPNDPPEIRQAILNRAIIKGMTMDQVAASWGAPTRMSSSSNGIDVWLYEERARVITGQYGYSTTTGHRTVTFRDGIVTSWSEYR